MGWSSGSDIAEVVIRLVRRYVPKDKRRAFFRSFVKEMYNHDWDGESDVEGRDPDFDAVLKELNPDWYDDDE